MMSQKGVLIVGELADIALAPITLQLLGAGRTLADDLGEGLAALFIGQGLEEASQEAIAYGADKVYSVEEALLAHYHPELFGQALLQAVQQLQPGILLLGQTTLGRDLAPWLSGHLETGLTTNCVQLAIDPESHLLLQTRPVFSGNARATTVCEERRPQMATLKLKATPPASRDATRQGQIVPLSVQLDGAGARIKVVEQVQEEGQEGPSLEDADVVVAGGLGVGGVEGFALLQELAEALEGVVGSSLPLVNAGTVPPTYHIGQTGKIVTPELYIAVGISGQPQHLAGCEGAKTIVAINRDPEANIFKVARFGVVGDFRQVVPALTRKCRELLSG